MSEEEREEEEEKEIASLETIITGFIKEKNPAIEDDTESPLFINLFQVYLLFISGFERYNSKYCDTNIKRRAHVIFDKSEYHPVISKGN